MDLDADLLIILRNSVPDLTGLFHHFLRGLTTFHFGLPAIPIHEPHGVRGGRGLGWLVLESDDDWYGGVVIIEYGCASRK